MASNNNEGTQMEDEELLLNIASHDFLNFNFNNKIYATDLVSTIAKTKQLCGVRTFLKTLKSGQQIIYVEHNFTFFGGSLGSAEGEKIVQSFKIAKEKKLPIILKCISGGARMQEGTLSLMQMAKVSCAVKRFKTDGHLPFISIIADPCFGGVSASYAMQGDLRIAEARCRLGFSGPAIILNTQFQMDQVQYDKNCPKEFQSSEFAYRNGQVDMVVPKDQIMDECDKMISILMTPRNTIKNIIPSTSSTSPSDTKDFLRARKMDRFDSDDIIKSCFENFVPFGGDGKVGIDFCIRAGIGLLKNNPIVIIKCGKGHSAADRKESNFSMPTPAGYRTALRFFEFAERFGLPVITMIDVVGAHPAFEAEIAGQSEAIASNLIEMAGLKVPIITLIVSEGGSGGALAIGMGDKIGIMENAYYGVITPEGAASILGKYDTDEQKKEQFPRDCQALARAQKIYSEYLLELGVVDTIVPESGGDDYTNFAATANEISNYFSRSLQELSNLTVDELVEQRQEKFLNMGRWIELTDYERNQKLEECCAQTPDAARPSRPIPPEPHKALSYLAEVTVNGEHSFFKGLGPQIDRGHVKIHTDPNQTLPETINAKKILDTEGPRAMAAWVRRQKQILLTDTTMRDAHQSLLATRVRTIDLLNAASTVSHVMHDFFSIEMWGGATYDVAYRFLREDPWDRLRELRKKIPNVCFQMLLRGANAVGYTSYPDSVVEDFVALAAKNGMDVFRIFDCFNDINQMKVAIDATIKANKVAEVAICFTGDFLSPDEKIYTLEYYANVAKQISATGAHMVAIKDMAGLLKPKHAQPLVETLRAALGPDIPIHFHTHNTSSAQLATLHAMTDAGVDVVDGCVASMADTTSQPSLNAFLATMETHERDPHIPWKSLEIIDAYWLRLRALYSIYESGILSGSASVYAHQIPGGQYSNLYMQCKNMGIMDKWEMALSMYREVNIFFGDIIKVTPSSKVVGDVALMLVTSNVTPQELWETPELINWPVSAVELAMGQLGKPHHGWPERMLKAILGERKPMDGRPGDNLEAVDLQNVCEVYDLPSLEDAISCVLYPKVFQDYQLNISKHGPIWELPTTVFLYGFHSIGDAIEIDGQIIKLKRVGPLDFKNRRKLIFSVNGKDQAILVTEKAKEKKIIKAQEDGEIGSPVPGILTKVLCKPGQKIKGGDEMFVITSMKMEVKVASPRDGVVSFITVKTDDEVQEAELLARIHYGSQGA